MTTPFTIQGPALISFSGGRSSAYMLFHILDAHDGRLPDDVYVAFANTGKEMPETLDFVQECRTRWGVPIAWLEYDPEAEHGTRVVNHNSASRNGEPFAALIAKRKFLPNPVTRFCTQELKVRRMKEWMHKTMGYKRWVNAIGIRADEPSRVLSNSRPRRERFSVIMPMVYGGVTRQEVAAFWERQEFDLGLPSANGRTPLGNCDLCFLKGRATIEGIIRDRPDLAAWWIEMEADTPRRLRKLSKRTAVFRSDRPSYAEMLKNARDQGDMFRDAGGDDALADCMCTD